jgi:hypothetical protein
METRYAINLTVNELNLVADALESYASTIKHILDRNSMDNVNAIIKDIFEQYPSQDTVSEDMIIDADFEVIEDNDQAEEVEK